MPVPEDVVLGLRRRRLDEGDAIADNVEVASGQAAAGEDADGEDVCCNMATHEQIPCPGNFDSGEPGGRQNPGQ